MKVINKLKEFTNTKISLTFAIVTAVLTGCVSESKVSEPPTQMYEGITLPQNQIATITQRKSNTYVTEVDGIRQHYATEIHILPGKHSITYVPFWIESKMTKTPGILGDNNFVLEQIPHERDPISLSFNAEAGHVYRPNCNKLSLDDITR